MAISVTEAQRDLESLIEQVNLDRTAVEIVSERGSAVLLPKDEYDALVETGYLLRSPRNAQRLWAAMESILPRDHGIAHGTGRSGPSDPRDRTQQT